MARTSHSRICRLPSRRFASSPYLIIRADGACCWAPSLDCNGCSPYAPPTERAAVRLPHCPGRLGIEFFPARVSVHAPQGFLERKLLDLISAAVVADNQRQRLVAWSEIPLFHDLGARLERWQAASAARELREDEAALAIQRAWRLRREHSTRGGSPFSPTWSPAHGGAVDADADESTPWNTPSARYEL